MGRHRSATERARRPEELATHRAVQNAPSLLETCPFCPGNENKTPPEVMRFPSNTAEPWAVRVIPNKFAPPSSSVQPTRSVDDVWRRIKGFGFHEVISDAPDHSCCMASRPTLKVLSWGPSSSLNVVASPCSWLLHKSYMSGRQLILWEINS
jgi:UDPglucose--hexose-1-phosphate uridylyltransferase